MPHLFNDDNIHGLIWLAPKRSRQ